MKIVKESKSEVSQNIPPKWKLSESPNPRCPRILPQNENCHRIQIQGVPEYSPKWKLSGSPNPRCPRISPQNENCQRVQIRRCPRILPPKIKIVRESKSEGVPRILPPKMKIVIESKSKVSLEYSPSKWKLSYSPNPRCPRIPPQNENCHRVQIRGVPEYSLQMKIVIESKSKVSQNTPKWKLS